MENDVDSCLKVGQYYKAIFNLSQEPMALGFQSPLNITEFDLKKLNCGDTVEIPDPIEILVDLTDGNKELDVNLAICGTVIVSEKFKHIFHDEPLRFYPVEIVNYITNSKFYALELLDFCDCVDEGKSVITKWNEQNAWFNKRLIGMYKSGSNIHFNVQKISSNIFRLKFYPAAIIVSQRFVQKFMNNNLTGLKFSSIQGGMI